MLNPCLKYAFTLAPTIPNSWDIERRLGTRYITWAEMYLSRIVQFEICNYELTEVTEPD